MKKNYTDYQKTVELVVCSFWWVVGPEDSRLVIHWWSVEVCPTGPHEYPVSGIIDFWTDRRRSLEMPLLPFETYFGVNVWLWHFFFFSTKSHQKWVLVHFETPSRFKTELRPLSSDTNRPGTKCKVQGKPRQRVWTLTPKSTPRVLLILLQLYFTPHLLLSWSKHYGWGRGRETAVRKIFAGRGVIHQGTLKRNSLSY